jgi:hypothetical protein
METLSDILHQNYINFFHCKTCDFKCSKKGDWSRHLSTRKHQKANSGDTFYITLHHSCSVCQKQYKSRNGLWKHKKQCFLKNVSNIEPIITPEIIIDLIQQNKELRQTLIEQHKTIIDLACKTGTNNSYNNYNNTFNLQLFLNETCKDAINLTDFVNQLKISIEDLEETGKIGYANGISKVFIKNLNDIDYTKRPIHCSDSKREILYIKDCNHWLKDDNQKTNLTKAIKQVAGKNMKQISEWQKLNPEYKNPDSKINDKYMHIVLNSMSGSTKEESDKNYEKIVKNIVKEVIIQR